MKLIARTKSEQNEAAIDPWTIVHFSTGLSSGLIDLPLRKVLAAAAAYEILEQFGQRRGWGQRFFRVSGPESPENVAMDLAAFAAGYWLGQRWNRS